MVVDGASGAADGPRGRRGPKRSGCGPRGRSLGRPSSTPRLRRAPSAGQAGGRCGRSSRRRRRAGREGRGTKKPASPEMNRDAFSTGTFLVRDVEDLLPRSARRESSTSRCQKPLPRSCAGTPLFYHRLSERARCTKSASNRPLSLSARLDVLHARHDGQAPCWPTAGHVAARPLRDPGWQLGINNLRRRDPAADCCLLEAGPSRF